MELFFCHYNHFAIKRRLQLFWLITLCAMSPACAQQVFNGLLLNTADAKPLQFARVELKETKYQTFTDSAGRFSFEVSHSIKKLTLNISSVTCKGTVVVTPAYSGTERVFIDVLANPLTEFVFRGLSARQVLEKAIARIPENFDTRSHFAFAFYRDYEKVNGLFLNFTEAQIAVMFKLTMKGKQIVHNNAYTVKQIRRSKAIPIINDFTESSMDEVLKEDPIFNLLPSSLNPARFEGYRFNFDTSQKTDDYIVTYYRPDFSSEDHGCGYHDYNTFWGEETERGTVVIERGTFAIKKYTRNARINPQYDYGSPASQINIVYPSKKYFFRFVDADLTAEYMPVNGKWYLKNLMHRFTNDFFFCGFGSLAYNMTEYSEIRFDSVSSYVGEDIVNKFYPNTFFMRRKYDYDKAYWDKEYHPYFFESRDTVLTHLQKLGPLDEQFIAEGKKE